MAREFQQLSNIDMKINEFRRGRYVNHQAFDNCLWELNQLLARGRQGVRIFGDRNYSAFISGLIHKCGVVAKKVRVHCLRR